MQYLLTIYVDGAAVGSVNGYTGALTSSTIYFGRVGDGGNYFAGSLDEIALYGAVLDGTTIGVHYAAGR